MTGVSTGDVPPFGVRLADAMARYGPLCVGLDPYPDRIPDLFQGNTPQRIGAFCDAVIAAVAGRVAAIKPQIALFERYGPDGLAVLADLTRRAHDAGLVVLLDAKRGDIGATAEGYAQAYLGEDAWLHADAVTVNPLMGADTLAPWIALATTRAKGVIPLVRTSNAGAGDLQDLDAQGAPLWTHIARMLAPLAAALTPSAGEWSSLMVVVGATQPDQARLARTLLPNCLFLAPGYGAQGADAVDALAGAASTPRGPRGVLVNASRSVLYGAQDTPDLASWRRAIDQRLTRFAADISAGAHTLSQQA